VAHDRLPWRSAVAGNLRQAQRIPHRNYKAVAQALSTGRHTPTEDPRRAHRRPSDAQERLRAGEPMAGAHERCSRQAVTARIHV